MLLLAAQLLVEGEGPRPPLRDTVDRFPDRDASRAAKEQKVRSEEEGRRDDLVLKEGRLRCNLCGLSRFAIFEHKKCPAVERNIQERLAPKRKADAVAETQNVVHFFDQFLFTAKL